MAYAMLCAECGPPVPAAALVVHPYLYRMVVPSCGRHGEPGAGSDLDVIPFPSPEATEVLETHTLLRGIVVPRSGG